MKTQLLHEVEAALVINQLCALRERFDLPSGVKIRPLDRNYALRWHKSSLGWKSPFSNVSLHFSGRFDDQVHRCLSGEIRFFLSENSSTQGRFKAMLFARVGLGYGFKSYDLLENQEQAIDCPFIYGNSVEEVINTARFRMAAAIERAEKTDCSKWYTVYQADQVARTVNA